MVIVWRLRGFGAVAFAEARRLINTLSDRKSRPAGTVAGTAVERKSSLRGHFEGLLGGLTDAPVPHMETVLPPQNIADGEFTIAEVAAASVPFKNGKAAGLDGIQAELIKLSGIAEELTPMLNAIYVSGNALEAFRRAAIVPIPKKGDLSQLGNWRGISLMSLLGKL